MRSRKRQLFQLSGPSFRMPLLTDIDGKLVDIAADYLPLIYWPDGSWCVEANRFIRRAYEQGRSRKNKGGTLKQIASQISPLLRFCWANKLPLQDLTDQHFRQFILSIIPKADGSLSNEEALNSQSSYIRGVGRTCLAMLQNMAEHAADSSFVGPNGQIRAYFKRAAYSNGTGINRRTRSGQTLHHDALPTGSPRRKRRPVSNAEIEMLRKAAESIASEAASRSAKERRSAMFVLQRRLLCIRVFESAPPRRGEVAELRVSAIRRAARMAAPMLEMTTLKSGGETSRWVPVTHTLISALLSFDEMERGPLLRRLKAPENDYLFVSSVTGQPLDWDSITQDMRVLARRAGLPHPVTPHMFRHRFITKLFVDLIQLHDLTDVDSLRRLLLSSEDLLIKVQQWTGHKSVESLRTYIHEAFNEVSGLRRSLDLVRLKHAVDCLSGSFEDSLRLARAGRARTLDTLEKLQKQIDQFKREVAWIESQSGHPELRATA